MRTRESDSTPSCPAVWDPTCHRYCLCLTQKGKKKGRLVYWNGSASQNLIEKEESIRFPLKDRPVALVPLRTRGKKPDGLQGVLVVVYDNGKCAWVHSEGNEVNVLGKKIQEEEEYQLVSQISANGEELATAVWESAGQRYVVRLLATKHGSLSELGKAELKPLNGDAVLCGMSHLGSKLFCVWSDSSVQIYGPSKGSGGLVLLHTHQLTGFDFKKMMKRSKAEDLRAVSLQASVCTALGEGSLVVIVGPQIRSPGLRYVVFDWKYGFVQSSGTVLEKEGFEFGSIQVAKLQRKQGQVLITGTGKVAMAKFPIKATTMACIVGSQHLHRGSRKRKAEDDQEHDLHVSSKLPALAACGSHLPSHTMLSLPHWAVPLTKSVENGYPNVEAPIALPVPRDSDLFKWTNCDATKGNGFRNPGSHSDVEDHTSRSVVLASDRENLVVESGCKVYDRVVAVLEKLAEASEKQNVEIVSGAVQLLEECRKKSVVVTVDLVGMTAWYCGKMQDWEGLHELLAAQPLRSLSECPTLPSIVAADHRYGLLRKVLENVEHFPSGELAPLLEHLLSSTSDEGALVSQFNSYEHLRSSAEAAVNRAEAATGDGLPGLLEEAESHVLGVEGFSPLEVALHPIVCTPLDSSELAVAFGMLSTFQVSILLKFLERWLCRLVHSRRSAAVLEGQSMCAALPNLRQIGEWIGCLVSVQLPWLAQHTEHLEVSVYTKTF